MPSSSRDVGEQLFNSSFLPPPSWETSQLRPYFTALCESIGASMIRDHEQLTLSVMADDSTTTADTSVSLGLIVTELVINALKHAFPDNRKGKIMVDYHARGPNWDLSVGDDGVGMPTDPQPRQARIRYEHRSGASNAVGRGKSVSLLPIQGPKFLVEHTYVPVVVGQSAAVRAV